MIFPDYHLHSDFSSDGKSTMLNNIECAKANGLSSICITDHYDIDFPTLPDAPDIDFQLDTLAYFDYMNNLKCEISDSFDLRIGIELGLMPDSLDKNQKFVNDNSNLDFVIASTHVVDKLDPYYPAYFEDKTEQYAYQRYFEDILYNVSNYSQYDVYGHLDYILRYGPNKADNFESYFNSIDFKNLIEEILKEIISHNKGIEINTGSLYRGLSFPHPHKLILSLYKELGGEILTIGSDSHDGTHIGYGFDIARDLLLHTGFKYYSTFRNREYTFNTIL